MVKFSVLARTGSGPTRAACFVIGAVSIFAAAPAFADCGSLPDYGAVQEALTKSIKPTGGPSNGGLDLNMWATVVDRDGIVCVVTMSGKDRGDQWPGSRVIS